jgi:prepilin-type processing-associated H-X9-DG protein
MRQRSFPHLQMIAACVLLSIITVYLFPIITRMKKGSRPRRLACTDNLERLNLAIKQYGADYDEHCPLVKLTGGEISYGWTDALRPYIKTQKAFWRPEHFVRGRSADWQILPTANNYTDYWLNGRVSGLSESKVIYSGSTILAGDGNDGTDATNARYSLSTLPAGWRTDQDSPAQRHYQVANYLFFDGHIKWLEPTKISDNKSPKTNFTFAIR